jgi:tetratricopeptide (TPR) repeat protein
MNESDKSRARNVFRRAITLRREDHVGDAIGLVFLETVEGADDRTISRIGEYFGPRIKLLKAEIGHDEIVAEVETRGWPVESARLAQAAERLHKAGARRNAQALFAEALELDPLNAEALARRGIALADAERFREGVATLNRARELGAENVEILLAMARCANHLKRAASAIIYLERAHEIEPRNFMVRRALRELGRDPSRNEAAESKRADRGKK